MKVLTARKRRIYIYVSLYKNDEMIKKYSSVFKTRVLDFVHLCSTPESQFDRGECRIVYDAKQDLINEFSFVTEETFRLALNVATELPLLKYVEQGGW